MPSLHEETEEHIYTAILNATEQKPGPMYTYNPTRDLYEYSNSLYPNKNYTKTFDPKSFMTRGDVIHFSGDEYRNNNKMIFDGDKLIELHTEVDDYGSVPPIFVVGDNEGEFDIGDFEDLIDHNSINWLSKEKLQEIELFQKKESIFGKVVIKGTTWKILFEIHEDTEFNTGYGRHYSRQYKCLLENDNIIIDKPSTYLNSVLNNKYIITAYEDSEQELLLSLVQADNTVRIINYCRKALQPSQYIMETMWYLFQSTKEYKFDANQETINYPIIWQKKGSSYDCETLIFDQEGYNRYTKINESELDKIYISEVIGYTIKITAIKPDIDTKQNNIKQYINKLVENYDNIEKRNPVNHDGPNTLTMYI
jgi:hypothetical protein